MLTLEETPLEVVSRVNREDAIVEQVCKECAAATVGRTDYKVVLVRNQSLVSVALGLLPPGIDVLVDVRQHPVALWRVGREVTLIKEVCRDCVAASIEEKDAKQVIVRERGYAPIARRFLPPEIEIIVSSRIHPVALWRQVVQ